MSSLKPFEYEYHGFDGKEHLLCSMPGCCYRAHVTIPTVHVSLEVTQERQKLSLEKSMNYSTLAFPLSLCKTCLERMRITLKLAFKEYLAGLEEHKHA